MPGLPTALRCGVDASPRAAPRPGFPGAGDVAGPSPRSRWAGPAPRVPTRRPGSPPRGSRAARSHARKGVSQMRESLFAGLPKYNEFYPDYTVMSMTEAYAGVAGGVLGSVFKCHEVLQPADPDAGPSRSHYMSWATGLCLCPEVQRVSLVAVDNASGQLIGACVCEESSRAAEVAFPGAGAPFGAAVDALLGQLNNAYWGADGALDRGEVLHVFVLGVVKEHWREGVAERLVRGAVERAGQLGFRGVSIECTGAGSLALARKLGFAEVARVGYREFEHQGARPFAHLAESGAEGCVMLVKELD